MADQFASYDPSQGMVSTSGGRQFPASALDPSQLQSLPPAAPPGASPASPIDAPHPGASPKARSILGGLQLVQQTVNKGMPAGSVDAAMAGANAAEDAYAKGAEGAALANADRRMASNVQSREDAQQLEQDARQQEAMRRQRAEIARLNEGAIAAQQDPDVDPRRLIDSMSTGTKIVTVLLSALGGAAGAVTRTGNGAMQALNKAIDADIMAQKEQIASGRIRRGNIVDYFRRQGMSDDAAADAAHGVALANVERMAQLEAAALDTEQARGQAALIGEQLKASREGRNAELKLKLEGQQGTSSTFARPQPVSGPGAADVLKEALAARDLQSLGSTGMTSDEARQKALKDETRTEAEGKGASALAALDKFASKAGLLALPGGGFAVDKRDKNMFNRRQKERFGSIFPGGSQEIEAYADAAIEAFGRKQSGGVISDEEAVRFKQMIAGATTDQQLAERLNAIRDIVVPQLHARDRESAKAGVPKGWR